MLFRQPELHGPDGEPIEIPELLAKRIRQGVCSVDRPANISLPGVSGDLLDILMKTAGAIAGERVEVAVVFSPQGKRVYRASGSAERVEVPSRLLAGALMIHNHPEHSPLSLEDLDALFSSRLASVWAVGGPWLYGATVGNQGASKSARAQQKFRAAYLARAVYAVLSDMARRKELRPGQRRSLETIHQHVVLCELAGDGLIHYIRLKHATRP